MDYQKIINYKNVFIGATLDGVIYLNIVLPFFKTDNDRSIIEFIGQYNVSNTSSGTISMISFPIIPTF